MTAQEDERIAEIARLRADNARLREELLHALGRRASHPGMCCGQCVDEVGLLRSTLLIAYGGVAGSSAATSSGSNEPAQEQGAKKCPRCRGLSRIHYIESSAYCMQCNGTGLAGGRGNG